METDRLAALRVSSLTVMSQRLGITGQFGQHCAGMIPLVMSNTHLSRRAHASHISPFQLQHTQLIINMTGA
jgi:hypothetical protein